jgi:hypothetical protein
MSESRDLLFAVVNERQTFTGESCRNLVNGNSFTAEFEEITDLQLLTDLGLDMREAGMLHISDRAASDAIVPQQSIAIKLRGVVTTWKILKRTNNPASPQADFLCQLVVPGKDQ